MKKFNKEELESIIDGFTGINEFGDSIIKKAKKQLKRIDKDEYIKGDGVYKSIDVIGVIELTEFGKKLVKTS
jgi:hypothetical protein